MFGACTHREMRCVPLGRGRWALGAALLVAGFALISVGNNRAVKDWVSQTYVREADVVVSDCTPRAEFNGKLVSFLGCDVAPATNGTASATPFDALLHSLRVPGTNASAVTTLPDAASWARTVEEWAYAPDRSGHNTWGWHPELPSPVPPNKPWPAGISRHGAERVTLDVEIGAARDGGSVSGGVPAPLWVLRCADFLPDECPLHLARGAEVSVDPSAALGVDPSTWGKRRPPGGCGEGDVLEPGCMSVASESVITKTADGKTRFRFQWTYHPVPARLSGLARQIYTDGQYRLVPWTNRDAEWVYIFTAHDVTMSQLFALLRLPHVAAVFYVTCVAGWLCLWGGAHLLFAAAADAAENHPTCARCAFLRHCPPGTLLLYGFTCGLFCALSATAMAWFGVMHELIVPVVLFALAFIGAFAFMARVGGDVAYSRPGDGVTLVVHADTESTASSVPDLQDVQWHPPARPPSPPLQRSPDPLFRERACSSGGLSS